MGRRGGNGREVKGGWKGEGRIKGRTCRREKEKQRENGMERGKKRRKAMYCKVDYGTQGAEWEGRERRLQ